MNALIARVRELPVRIREGLARHGAKEFARQSLLHTGRLVRLREEHVWLELRLAALPPLPALDDGLSLVVASDDQLDLVEQMGQSAASARRYVAAGNEQMMLFEGDRLVFGCCLFHGEAPVLAAPAKQLRLPEDTVCIENSYTHPDYRRRGLGRAAVLAVIARLRAQGVQSLITKVEADNAPARKGLLKVGFQEIARVRLERFGPRKRVEVEVLGDAPTGAQLARSLGHPSG